MCGLWVWKTEVKASETLLKQICFTRRTLIKISLSIIVGEDVDLSLAVHLYCQRLQQWWSRIAYAAFRVFIVSSSELACCWSSSHNFNFGRRNLPTGGGLFRWIELAHSLQTELVGDARALDKWVFGFIDLATEVLNPLVLVEDL